MIDLNDLVEPAIDLPEHGLGSGSVGTVVHVFHEPRLAYEVEFTDDDGATVAMVPLTPTNCVPSLGPVSKCSVEPRRGPGGDPARRRFVWIPVLYPDETPTRPVVVWARRRLARHFETGPRY